MDPNGRGRVYGDRIPIVISRACVVGLLMHRVKKFYAWRRKKPMEGQSYARRTICLSNHSHRSGLEGRVCDELRLRKIAGDITDYRTEVPITLMEGKVNVSKYLGKYIADFLVEHPDGTQEIIEAKGIEWPTFKKKWKALEIMYRGDPKMTLTLVKK